jgi:bifunctional pyridoxal-dependent enzyme with beta-cystathionase and maltose regulon repressor activities
MDIAELQRAVDEAKKHCIPRAIVVINPGNPTGLLDVLFLSEDIPLFRRMCRFYEKYVGGF